MYGTVFNIQRFSLFDGPGVRTVVFLKGCPLRCIWCHNPEGIAAYPQVMYDPARCIGCGDCADVCPKHQHIFRDGLHGFIRTGCIGCGKCARVCCSGALSMAGQLMDTEAVISTVMRDANVYKESGGGMTLSGGEPLCQSDFAIDLLRIAREQGITTCVETCGQVAPDKFLEAAKYTDYFYFDYKATGDEMHKRLCGAPQGRILGNLEALDKIGANVTLRCPIVAGENDVPEHIDGIARTAAAYSCIREVQLEPYHRLGVSKSEKLGQTAEYDGTPPERLRLEMFCEEIKSASGKNCTVV